MPSKILTIKNKKEERFLREKTNIFEFSKRHSEVQELVKTMRETMKEANGVGLAANQIGLNTKIFVAQVPDPNGSLKFYALFNPRIEKTSGEKLLLEEGCLSVPGVYGKVERYERVRLVGFDKNGRSVKIKAWGLLAHVFQHEIDHLNGVLFIDKAKELYEVSAPDRLMAKNKAAK